MLEKRLEEILKQEKELVFDYFNNYDAFKLGNSLAETAIKKDLPISIRIIKGEHILYQFSNNGTSPDNDAWMERKIKTVKRFGVSSFNMGTKLKLSNKTIEEKYLIPESEFAAHGGAFPINIKDTGLIGVIVVSGLSQDKDHQIVTEAIREYLDRIK